MDNLFSDEYINNEVKGGMDDKDFNDVSLVYEKQDLFSKSSRNHKVSKIWIPRLIYYCYFCAFLIFLFCSYGFYYYFNKENTLSLINRIDGVVMCVDSYIEKNGEMILATTPKRQDICNSIKSFNKINQQ